MPPVVTTRPMTEEERALLLRAPVRLFGWWSGIISAACVFLVTYLAASLSSLLLPYETVVRIAGVAAVLASVATYMRIQRRARKELREQAAATMQEAAAGDVQSTIYQVTDAVVVEEHEDEGLSYYLLMDDGRTLFLSGQYLYEPADNGFPWESFEVVRVASGGWVLRVVPLGPPLMPTWTRAPFSERERQSGQVSADGAIDNRDFNALKVGAD